MTTVPVRLKSIGRSEVYELTTHSKVVVEGRVQENNIKTVVRLSLLDQSSKGDLISVEVLSSQQSAKDGVSVLIADINQLNRRLVFETDLDGRMIRLVNYSDLGNDWYPIKEDIKTKYGRSKEIENFLAVYEKSLFAGEAPLLEAMQHKGVYGVLFAGIYAFGRNPKFQSKRVLKNYFNTIDLPLVVDVQTASTWKDGVAMFMLSGQGRLDEETFKKDEFRTMIRQMRDSFNLRVELQVTYGERYELKQSDAWITEAHQVLKAEVPALYLNEVIHSLKLSKPA